MSDDLLHRLIGCDWGHRIGEPDSPPCPNQAVRRVALHLDPDDFAGTPFKFCADHLAHVTANTEDRTSPVVETPSPELEAGIHLAETLLEADPPADVAEEVEEMLGTLKALRDRDT